MPNEMNNYIEDDWNDNSLENRSNPEKGIYYSRTEAGTGDLLKGVYRPRWREAPQTSVGSGVIDFGASNASVVTPSKLASGTGGIDFKFDVLGSSYSRVVFALLDKDGVDAQTVPDNGYYIQCLASSFNFDLMRANGGSRTDLIQSSWSGDTSYHTISMDRNAYGGFEILEDGVSRGTVDDTTLKETEYIRVGWSYGDSGSKAQADNLRVN